MGHCVSSKQAYLDLQTRLDRNVTGAPPKPPHSVLFCKTLNRNLDWIRTRV